MIKIISEEDDMTRSLRHEYESILEVKNKYYEAQVQGKIRDSEACVLQKCNYAWIRRRNIA